MSPAIDPDSKQVTVAMVNGSVCAKDKTRSWQSKIMFKCEPGLSTVSAVGIISVFNMPLSLKYARKCILYGFPHEMDFSHHKSPNPTVSLM